MPTDYDPIAAQYQRAKQHPWRGHIEAYTFLGLIGDLSGRAVVDLACGEGHYTRMLPGLGAKAVVGVDGSAGMIDLARAQEAHRPQGIEYVVQDCRTLRLPEPFDVVVAAYLLNYARDRGELQALYNGIAGCLRPGGTFVTINSSPGLDAGRESIYRKYGFSLRADGPPREGRPITWTFHNADGPVEVENYDLPLPAHDDALAAAGFTAVRWHRPQLSPAGASAREPGFWQDFLDHPPVIALTCRLG